MMQGGSMFLGGAIMWIFWILIAVVLIALLRALFNRSHRQDSGEASPLAILERRFARGEIDEGEFRARRRELLR